MHASSAAVLAEPASPSSGQFVTPITCAHSFPLLPSWFFIHPYSCDPITAPLSPCLRDKASRTFAFHYHHLSQALLEWTEKRKEKGECQDVLLGVNSQSSKLRADLHQGTYGVIIMGVLTYVISHFLHSPRQNSLVRLEL